MEVWKRALPSLKQSSRLSRLEKTSCARSAACARICTKKSADSVPRCTASSPRRPGASSAPCSPSAVCSPPRCSSSRVTFTELLLAGILGLAATSPAWAINKCTGKDGKVVYQDAPCDNTTAKTEDVKTWGAGKAAPSAPGTNSLGSKPVVANADLQGPEQAEPLLAIYRRWVDAERLATSTARVALAGPVATMQAVHRDAQVVRVPACMAEARKALIELTGKSTTALIEFMRQNELQTMVYSIVDRKSLVRAFEAHIERADCDAQASR